MYKSKIPTAIATIVTAATAITASMQSIAAGFDLYQQNFESMAVGATGVDAVCPNDLCDDGWLYFGAEFDSSGTTFTNGYGGSAPNHEGAFSGVAAGGTESGAAQGARFLNIYSDYQNPKFASNDIYLEASVFQEWTIATEDIGKTITFIFDAKRPSDGAGGAILASNCSPVACKASAFIKTIDPNDNFAQTNLVIEDTTAISQDDWGTYTLTLEVDSGLVGQLLQVGFNSFINDGHVGVTSGVYYDNITVTTLNTINVPFPAVGVALFGGLLGLTGIRSLRKRLKG